MKKLLFALVLALPIAFGLTYAQTSQETSATVPALDTFHEVIMPMWHSAYPSKDYAALRKASPDVAAGVKKIADAKLPGILREKEAAWAKGLAKLQTAADAYVKAASGSDDAALMAAAETLHTTYEALVQVVRPVVPEMNEFHKTLYVVQHTYVPAKDWAAVCKVSAELQTKAEAVSKATLPKRVAAKKDLYTKAAADLAADAKALVSACGANQPAGIEKATDTLHARYEGLAAIFE